MPPSRPLLDTKNVVAFMRNVLSIDFPLKARDAKFCIKIRDVEQLLSIYFAANTIKTADFRHPRFYDEEDREKLRQRIITELIQYERLEDDDKIGLGKGGMRPRGWTVLAGKTFFLITGLPASGKSSIANKISDGSKSIIIDSDFAKRKFPEFGADYGAALVHEEASLITEGPLASKNYEGLNILEIAITQEFNIVLPKICSSEAKTKVILEYFHNLGYRCYFVHVELDREKATRRAFERFKKTNRYVPLALIYDDYSNNPTLTYMKMKTSPFLDGSIHLSNDVRLGELPKVIEALNADFIKQWIE